jgi:tetratricopeptide (TPR) repeat protein
MIQAPDSAANVVPPLPQQPPAPSQPATPAAAELQREPLSYTPQYLAEKILTSRSALEGERKQVTMLFADTKDSTELIKDLDPEDAQKLLDPAIYIMMEAVHRYRQAGARAMARSAHREAAAFFEQALSALQHLPKSHDIMEQAIDLRFELCGTLITLGEVKRVFDYLREAEALAHALNDRRRLGRASSYLSVNFFLVCDPDQSIISSHLGYAYALSGRIVEALPLLEQGMKQSASMNYMLFHAFIIAWLSEAYLLDGRIEEASQLAKHALELSQNPKERGHQAHALHLLGDIAMHRNPPKKPEAILIAEIFDHVSRLGNVHNAELYAELSLNTS